MAEGKRITELGEEAALDSSDLLLIGSNGSSSLTKTTLGRLALWIFGGKSLVDKIYPVGSIYMTTATTNPSDHFGGTWELLKDRVLIGAGGTYSVNATGGEASTTLAVANLPAHTHTGPSHTHSGPSHTHTGPSHSHTVTAAGTKLTTDSGGAHTHIGKYNTDGASGSAKTRYFPDGGTESSKGLVKSGGAHSHSIASHTHAMSCANAGTGNTGASGTGQTGAAGTGATGSTGSGTAFTNLPPYRAVYIWRRTA